MGHGQRPTFCNFTSFPEEILTVPLLTNTQHVGVYFRHKPLKHTFWFCDHVDQLQNSLYTQTMGDCPRRNYY